MEIIGLAESHHGSHLESISKYLESTEAVNGIFMEFPQDLQPAVDQYLLRGTIAWELERLFKAASGEGKGIRETTLVVLKYARDRQIPVVCIDSSKVQTEKYDKKSQHGYWFLSGESRNEDMFSAIKERLADGEKWLVLGGLAHLKLGLHFRSGDETLGERLHQWLGDGFNLIELN